MFGRFSISIACAQIAAMLFVSSHAAEVRWTDRYVEVTGIDPAHLASLQKTNWALPQWQKLLSIHAEQSDPISDLTMPAMSGDYRVEGGNLRFTPAFPLEPGIKYRAVFRPSALGQSGTIVAGTHQLKAVDQMPTTRVAAIYPSASTLPQNLLKFYIYFSAPMGGGHIYDHIRLTDDAGKSVELPFLEIDEELWDPEMTRLTLFLDPGRIKRGVQPLEEIGPALMAGRSFTLSILPTWRDAAGIPLKSSFEKKLTIVEPDRVPPDPALWKINPPKSDHSEPVTLVLNEPLDRAIMERKISVSDSQGAALDGSISITENETRWSFTPNAPWRAGEFRIMVPTRIEDLAGNNIGKQFDVDLSGGEQKITNSFVRLSFTVR